MFRTCQNVRRFGHGTDFGVSINSILLASNTECRLIHYRDNLIVKLLYWPMILASLLVITLINFY